MRTLIYVLWLFFFVFFLEKVLQFLHAQIFCSSLADFDFSSSIQIICYKNNTTLFNNSKCKCVKNLTDFFFQKWTAIISQVFTHLHFAVIKERNIIILANDLN